LTSEQLIINFEKHISLCPVIDNQAGLDKELARLDMPKHSHKGHNSIDLNPLLLCKFPSCVSEFELRSKLDFKGQFVRIMKGEGI
jgi:hypothetical protein